MNDTKAAGKQRGPWGSHAEARAWRAKAQGEVAAGTARRSNPTQLRAAWEDFIAQAKAGTAVSRSRTPFKPATLRGYERGWKKD